MKPQLSILLTGLLLLTAAAVFPEDPPTTDDWKRADTRWEPEFPRDHFNHPNFKTEWWYFTGHLHDVVNRKREYGFQITFFRQGIRPPGNRNPARSRFVRDHFYFGHFAISDLDNKRFFFDQIVSRGAFEEAGANNVDEDNGTIVWLHDWNLKLGENGTFHCLASMSDPNVRLQTTFSPSKPFITHGKDGISQKAAGKGNASHYYSCSRMNAKGSLLLHGREFEVSGSAWLDREWATNQLAPNQAGWDWFSIQFDDNSELMVYQLRKKDGGQDPVSSGTWIAPNGTTTHLKSTDFLLKHRQASEWKSPHSSAVYPLSWSLQVPSKRIELTTTPVMKSQELYLPPLTYWEGAIHVSGSKSGRGYMELTGYGGDVSALTGGQK